MQVVALTIFPGDLESEGDLQETTVPSKQEPKVNTQVSGE